MKNSNGDFKQRADLVDDKGNSIEFIRSEEESSRRLGRILGVYCRLIGAAITKDQ